MWELGERFEFNGHPVAWDSSGEGPPLVLIHGTPFSSAVWHRIAPWLEQSFRIYAFDLLGYGESDKGFEGNVSLGIQNELFSALLDHWGLDAPHVVGHDFGGTTALRTHLLQKREFASMTLINPVAMAPVGSAFVKAARNHKQAFQALPPYIHDAVITRYIEGAAHHPLRSEVLDRFKAPWQGQRGQRAFYEQIAQMDQGYTDEVEPLYGAVRCPTRIIWGREDTWIPLENSEKLDAMIPQAELRLVEDAGHLVLEDAPEAIVAELVPFLLAHTN